MFFKNNFVFFFSLDEYVSGQVEWRGDCVHTLEHLASYKGVHFDSKFFECLETVLVTKNRFGIR